MDLHLNDSGTNIICCFVRILTAISPDICPKGHKWLSMERSLKGGGGGSLELSLGGVHVALLTDPRGRRVVMSEVPLYTSAVCAPGYQRVPVCASE